MREPSENKYFPNPSLIRDRYPPVPASIKINMTGEFFPALSKETKTKDEIQSVSMTFLDKLKTEKKEEKKELSVLPPGWIVLDGQWKKRRLERESREKEKEKEKEETASFDFTPLKKMWNKRKETYITIYGEDHYNTIFGSKSSYSKEDTSTSETENSENEILSDHLEEDISSIE